ncbi:MAG TPA: ribonuclease PH [Alphaproteobacteria bacterium]|nr:ribonuclease PH [Alphaproteobacteria bacterium]
MGRSGRDIKALRDISLTCHVNPHAEGSCLIKCGQTEVLCTATLQDNVPRWLKGQGKGWITAEYGMLPRATHDRKDREATKGKQEGRTVEIQRLIGRSLRASCDLTLLNGFTLWIDCDVLVADGGTRTAAITGGYVALALAVAEGMRQGLIRVNPLKHPIAATSCGVTPSGVVLDMDYAEDSTCDVDGNFVMTGAGEWLEVQMTGEKRALKAVELTEMMATAEKGIRELFELQRQAIESASR